MEEEEERNRANEAIKKNTISVQTQEDRWKRGVRNEQANVYRNINTGLKREVKVEVSPPGLSYGEVEQRYFSQ